MASSDKFNSPKDEVPSKLSLVISTGRLRASSNASSTSISDTDTPTVSPNMGSRSLSELYPLPSPVMPNDEGFSSDHSIASYTGKTPTSSATVSRQSSLRYTKSIHDTSSQVSEGKDKRNTAVTDSSMAKLLKPRISDASEIVIPKKVNETDYRKKLEKLQLQTYNEFGNMQREKIRQTSSMVSHNSKDQSPGKEQKNQIKYYEAYDLNGVKHRWSEFKQLGRGAFSRVILGRSVSNIDREFEHDELVAIKIVTLGSKTANSARQQIETGLTREVDILKEAKFPSLITLLAFNLDSTRALMVLPYYEGGDLFDFIEQHGPLLRTNENDENEDDKMDKKHASWHLIRRIFAEVVNAVVYLHSKNVVHRDIKLENVLLKLQANEILSMSDPESYPEPICALTDLGLARRIDPEKPMLTTRCGSDDYVPPEIMMGRHYDGRETDSWALGVLLYAMIERRLPFDPPNNGNPKARNRVSHRIARVEWSWNKLADVAEKKSPSNPWTGATEIVEGCLQRRDQRWLASGQIISHPWLSGAAQII